MTARRSLRLAGVWLAAVLAATWLVALASADLVDAVAALSAGTVAAAGFTTWVVWAAALVASSCAGWFAVAATMVVASAVRAARPDRPRVPGLDASRPARRLRGGDRRRRDRGARRRRARAPGLAPTRGALG